MKKGICMYCKKNTNLNKEHAFPRSLLQQGAPGWTINKHSCAECNEKLGKLDEILASRGPIGHTWSQVKSESGQETKDRQSYRYEKRVHGIEPERMMIPDPILGYRIALFKLLIDGNKKEEPLNSLEPLTPQIILTLCSKEQTIEKAIAKNAKRFASLDIIPVDVSDTSKSMSTYCIGNPVTSPTCTVVCPPETIKYFHHKPHQFTKLLNQFDSIQIEEIVSNFRKELQKLETELSNQLHGIQQEKVIAYLREQPQEFESELSNQFHSIQKELIIIKDGKNTDHDRLTSFVDSIPIDKKNIVDKKIYLKAETYANLSRSETLRGRFIIGSEVESYIWRAIAKIAFHCLLYHYNKFSGHEPMFDSIKSFIYEEGIDNTFVTSRGNSAIKNPVYDSNTHFHNISFFVQEQDIGCHIDLFTGISNQPFSFEVNLAGKIENWKSAPTQSKRVPFYVNPKGEMKKRVHLVANLEVMQDSIVDNSEIIQIPSLEQIFAFGLKGN